MTDNLAPNATLRSHRRERNLTLATVAERAHLSVSYLSDYERGARNLYKAETLIRVADAYEFDRVLLLVLAREHWSREINDAIRANGGRP